MEKSSTFPVSEHHSETFGQDLSFHLDQHVGSMSISPSGRDVVLASREGLHIIDLDSPYSPPRFLQHRTSWEVADVQWSPFSDRDFWVVSTSNQKALVWNLSMSPASGSIEFVLHGHSRAITDINFSAHHPDILATCAVDSFVHCWDLRDPLRPVNTFSDWFAGATQVKWSRQDPHVVASSHDKYLRIWDDRMGAYPVRSIEAHGTKIYGVDWNRFHPNKIVTCSLDKTIKFWDSENPEDVPERVIHTPFPVWRARHTPFGWGMLAMPQRGNGDLHLYDQRSKETDTAEGVAPLVTDFSGHKGQVKEFLWRVRGPIVEGIDHRDFQLVSWGTDRELKLHRVETETLRAVGYEKGRNEIRRLNFTRQGARYRTFRDEPSELKYGDTFDSHNGSSPTMGQMLQVRPRGSISVGMSKVPVPRTRGFVQGRVPEPRIGMHGKVEPRQETNPISWMKNVKITSWDQDSLAEEITQVGEKFTKVEFETIDVQKRRTTISVQGPWATDGLSLYIRVDMQFPKGYPREGVVEVKVQKTGSMTDELLTMLSTELRIIAETHSTKKRGCLEAVLRYLLREQGMEQIVSLILEEPLVQSDVLTGLDLPGDLSSDDDDDQSGAFQGPQDLLRSSDMLNTNVLVPVAKACGALWSETGKLVCFFPPKPRVSSMIMDSFAKTDSTSSRTSKLFEGFGRLQARRPALRTTQGTVTTGDDAGSDTSDASILSTSSSSASSDILASLPTTFLPPQAWRGGGLGLQRSRSTDRSNKSINGMGNVKSTTSLPSNFVSIHSLEHLVPFSADLASEYKVFGSSPLVCDHNAEVARRHGYNDVADVWKLVEMILGNDVPLECTAAFRTGGDVLTIAQSAFNALRRRDSGVDLSQDAEISSKAASTYGRIRWGGSSFGSRHLVSAIFDHFENLGDVQMLAMLSCVLAEPRAPDSGVPLMPPDGHHLPLPLKCPAFSVDYYPSGEVAQHLMIQALKEPQVLTSTTLALNSSPAGDQGLSPSTSADAPGNSARKLTFPAGSTPPHHEIPLTRSRRSSRPSAAEYRELPGYEDLPRPAVPSISTSPEDSRLSHRSNSGLAFSFSRANLTAFAQSYSGSPPTNASSSNTSDPVKKPSPSGSLDIARWSTSRGFGNSRGGRIDQSSSRPQVEASLRAHLFPSASSLSSRSHLRDGGRTPDYSRTRATPTMSDRASADLRTVRGKRTIKIRSALHNQNKFDIDGYASVSLLDINSEWKFKAYRSNYAYLLGAWELYSHMAEVLKFDGLIGYFSSSKKDRLNFKDTPHSGSPHKNNGRRETVISISKAATESRGVETRRRCQACGEPFKAIEKNGIPIGWHCTSPTCSSIKTKRSTRLLCVVCEKATTGLMTPCLQCSHVTCSACAEGWFGRSSKGPFVPRSRSSSNEDDGDESKDDERTCPSGCGCHCLTSGFATVAQPDDPDSETEPQSSRDRRPSNLRVRSDRLMSQHGPDTAIGAFLSLTRTQSISAAKESVMKNAPAEDTSAIDDSDPVGTDQGPGSKYAALGRGIGRGLSRGLRNKSSDMTIKPGHLG